MKLVDLQLHVTDVADTREIELIQRALETLALRLKFGPHNTIICPNVDDPENTFFVSLEPTPPEC